MISRVAGWALSVLNLMETRLGLTVVSRKYAQHPDEELLSYYIEDPGTHYILLYLEESRTAEAHGSGEEIPARIVAFKSNIGQFDNPSPPPTRLPFPATTSV